MKIAFGFKMRSGKDTCVDYLLSKYGGKRVTFAKPLYDALYSVQNIFGLPMSKDREFLQMIGDWARKKDDNIFVNLAINRHSDFTGNKFCNDLRFLMEYEALKKDGWTCIKINRDTHSDNVGSTHRSETELESIRNEDWDFIIDNNGTIEELHAKLDAIVSKLKKI